MMKCIAFSHGIAARLQRDTFFTAIRRASPYKAQLGFPGRPIEGPEIVLNQA
jgi:hypothetical protein